MKQKPKALVLFSGGLDSRLIIQLLKEQDIILEAVYFNLPFGEGCCNNKSCVFNYSQTQGIKLHIIDMTKQPLLQEYLNLIKKPKFQRGRAFNPCKDCRIFMFKKAKELMEKINADFIVTGEVLDQRPNSQKKNHLLIIDKEAGLEGKVLRPLSAKLLEKTIPEKNKLVKRSKFLGIQGKQRKIQINLAEKYKIKYPTPTGGCLLCDKNYRPRISYLINDKDLNKITEEQIKILNIGRHFKNNSVITIGRNEKENSLLEELNKSLKYNIIIPDKIPGPTAIFEDINDKELAEKLQIVYSKTNNPEERKLFERYKLK